MKITEKLVKPIHEAKYLNVENSDRYRSIARLFYLNYEKLKYWMYQEEVYAELTEDAYFDGYTMEQCQQDLETLTEWGNLATIQDTRRVSTIEEFKNKKFRYQLTETTVEIERMVIRLENLFIEGTSLEPFFTFSGGEKAMSMYVPLFSAVVAKYAGAREDSPRLISLDEAFAGVDETNIRDMFRLMVECRFNFMINSQVLWGDYDTVPGLAIYQLLRPENAKFVTVIQYIWNGSERVLVHGSTE